MRRCGGSGGLVGAFQGLSREQVPHASSVTRIVQYVGGSFGAAVLVAVILDRQIAVHAAAGAAGLPALMLSGRVKAP